MTPFQSALRWLNAITLLPAIVWIIIAVCACLKAEPGSETRRKLRLPAGLLTAFGVYQIIYSIVYSMQYGFDTFLSETVLISWFLGAPFLALTLFIPSFIRYKRCPKDDPARAVFRRRLLIILVICGILLAVFIAFMIWFAIGIAHM